MIRRCVIADKFQGEATRTFRSYDLWTSKTRDFYYDVKTRRNVYPDTGFPDMRVFVNTKYESTYPVGLIEVKTADVTRFSFGEWREPQREWYNEYAKSLDNYYWLFIMFGKARNSKKYPRRPLLIQAERLIKIEDSLDRKSMPYDLAEETGLMLSWSSTTGSWSLKDHPFEHTFMRERKVDGSK